METRAFIEESGVGSRWEFDKKILFGLVDHVTRISQDVSDVAKVKCAHFFAGPMLSSHAAT
jgi:dynein heavy chain